MKADSSSGSVVNEQEGSCKKLRLTGEKLSLKSKTPEEETRNEKESVPPSRKLSISRLQKPLVVNSSGSAITEHGKAHCEQVPSRDGKDGLNGECKQVEEKTKEIESIIVSDSEESDEDDRPMRSRLSLMRKQMMGRLN